MAELVVTTSLDRSGFDKGVAEITTAMAQISAKPIKVKIDGDFSKITADVAKIAVAQEKTKQAIEATKQAQISANAAMAASAAKVAVAQEQVNLAHEKGAQAAATAAGKVAVQQEKTATEAEKTAGKVAQANARIAASQGRVSAEEQKTQQQIEKTAQQHERTAQAAIRAGAQHEAAARRAATATDQLANSVNRVSEAFSGWVTRNIWNALRNGLRDALNTMREMDTQLTTIRRVSGASEAEAAAFQEQAYDMSAKYGVKPADYLANVVAYTRAGYGQLAGDLAEVTTRLQVVGQVSQETATQMLLAVDAAYQLEGNADALGAVLDGVVAIGDNYATSVEKIAEGIGIIAPIAAQAHVSIGELSAAIGTITADTQRSGTEAARALRYIMLNIMGQVGAEVEDGVEMTEEEVKGLGDVIKMYIGDVWAEAAKAGKTVNPMEVLGALAKAFSEEKINEQELLEQVTKVAGKLRASQVLALIRDWDKYSDMVKLFGDSIGETDGKLEVALSSWESKANMLSASFTKLFGNVLNSGMVKGGIDSLKSFVDLLNIGDGTPAKILAVGAAFSTLGGIIASFAAGGRVAATLSTLASFFTSPAFIAGAAIAGTIALIERLVVTQEELEEEAANSAKSYEEQKTQAEQITSELEDHKKIIAELEGKSGSLTEAEQARLDKEREITAELERQNRVQEYKTEKSWREAASKAAVAGLGETADMAGIDSGKYKETLAIQYSGMGITGAILSYTRAKAEHEAAVKAYNDAVAQERYEEVDSLAKTAAEWEEALVESRDGIASYLEKNDSYYKLALDYAENHDLFQKNILTSEEKNIVGFINYYKGFLDYIGSNFPEFASGAATTGGEAGEPGAGGSSGTAAATQTAWQKSQDQQLKKTQALVKANKEYNDTLQTGQKFARISAKTQKELADAGFDLKDAVIQDGEAFIITREALDGFIKSSKEWYEGYGLEMPDNFKAIADNADEAADSIEALLRRAGGMADDVAAASKALADLKAQIKDGGISGDTLTAYRTEYKAVMELWEKGFYGHQELQGFMRLVLGDDKLAELGYDFKEAGKLLGTEFYKALFAPESADDYGIAALQVWANKYKQSGGDVVDSNGDVVASFKYVDGQIKAVVNDYDAAAKVLDVNVNTLYMLTDALGIYKNGLNTTGRDIKNLIDGLGDLSTNAEQAGKRLTEIEGNKLFHQGNVARNAADRPKVTLTAAQAKEWGGKAGDTASLLSQAWGYGDGKNGYTVIFTPILPDGTVMDEQSVASYLEETLGAGSERTIEEILAGDAEGLGIIQGIVEGTGKEARKVADAYGQWKHELHEVQWFAAESLSDTIDMDKLINRLAMEGKNGQEIFQLINAMKELGDYEFYGDSADPSDLISRIQTAVANANNKDLQLKPDASGWVQYQTDATNAMQSVADKWASSSSEINGVTPKPSVDTGDLENAITEIDDATGAVEGLGAAEGTGKAGMETDGVPEGTEEVKGAGEALEDFDGAKGDAGAHLDDEGVAGAAEEVETANKIVKDFNGVKGEGKADLDTENLDPGKELIQQLINKLFDWGAIDETAKAALEADLDDPEARVKVAQALLVAFADTPGTATAGLNVDDMNGVLPSVNDAKETLEGYGVNYDAVVGLEDNVPYGDQEKFEGLLVTLLALDKTFLANVEISGDGLTDDQKLAKVKELHEYLEELKNFSAIRQTQYIAVDVDPKTLEAAESKIDTFIESTKGMRLELEIILMYSSFDDADSMKAVEAARERLKGVQAELTTKIKQEGAEAVERSAELVTNAIADIPDFHKTDIDAEDKATSVIRTVLGELAGLDGQTAKVYIQALVTGGGKKNPGASLYNTAAPGTTFNGNGTFTLANGQTYADPFGIGNQAEGTRNYPGGRSLVNELGPELIAYGGRAFVAGGGYPTIVNLPKGAMIFDADETRSIVANSGGLPTGVIGSHAGGIDTKAVRDTKGARVDHYEPAYTTSNAGNVGGINLLGAAAAAAVGTDWTGTFDVKNKGKGDKYGKGGGGGPAVDNTDYWAIVEAHYKEITAVADNAATNLEYQIKLLKDAWDDEKKPLDEQIKALQDLNGIIDRQITLLTRERDKLTKPIQDEVDALKEAKDIQDDQLELEERQKAVEEARAELQNAQNERTIRFFNKETGHWEWMADQKRIQSAQEALESAEKSLADFQYDLQIKALENEIKAIEAEYQEKFDALNADKQENEDTIYDLQQELKELERRYNELMGPLEEEKEDRSRAKAALENAWTNAQFERREGPTGNLDLAISKTGVPGSIAGGGIKELQADLKTIANAYKGSQQNNTLASLGIQFGATPSYAGTSSVTTVGNSVTDSHDIVINGITLPASAAYQSLMDLANDLSIYVNYK